MPPGLVVGSPVFSPDGKHVAFNFFSGTVSTNGRTPERRATRPPTDAAG